MSRPPTCCRCGMFMSPYFVMNLACSIVDLRIFLLYGHFWITLCDVD